MRLIRLKVYSAKKSSFIKIKSINNSFNKIHTSLIEPGVINICQTAMNGMQAIDDAAMHNPNTLAHVGYS